MDIRFQIDDKHYAITSDANQYIINSATPIQSGENEGTVKLKPMKYYATLTELFSGLQNLAVRGSGKDISTFSELSEHMDIIKQEIHDMVVSHFPSVRF